MTATADDLARARRLVESPYWRWMPGMRAVEYAEDGTVIADATVLHVDEDGHALMAWPDEEGCVQQEWDAEPSAPDWLPDFSDPATEGCLLRLAREAWAPRGGRVHVGPSSVAVYGHGRDPQWWDGPTGAALAHAILAAGEVRDA